jgi:hypothetical protein
MAGMMQPPGSPDLMPPQGAPDQMPQAQPAPDDGGGLDTAATAGAPQASNQDADTFATMVAGLRKYVFGPGEQGIVQGLMKADDKGRVLGEMVFSLVQEAAKQAKTSGRELDMDILMGVATELIDDITELLSAQGITIQQKEREYALLYAQQLYVQSYNPTDDDRNAAKAQLAQYQQSGDVNTAVKYVQQRGAEEGTDPFGVGGMPGGQAAMMGKEQ